jgi:hypothetical protein
MTHALGLNFYIFWLSLSTSSSVVQVNPFFSLANNFHEMVRRSKARPEVKLGRRRRMLAPKK